MSWEEFMEWQAFASMEPLTGSRMDANAALIACTVANSVVVRGRRPTLFDYMFNWWKSPKGVTSKTGGDRVRSQVEGLDKFFKGRIQYKTEVRKPE